MKNDSVNRSLPDEMFDHIDHALGRPKDPLVESYRNHYAATEAQAEQFRSSPFWDEICAIWDYPTFRVNDDGRYALSVYLKEVAA